MTENAPTELDFKRELKWLRSNNIKPVPIVVGSKAAANRDYVADDYEPPSDELWTMNPGKYGLGMKTGIDSGRLVDIDLDCAEAIFFAQRLLPPTSAVFGRASKPRSHYLYRVTDGSLDTFKILDPTQQNPSSQTILEFRGSGGNQTVCPPTVHESGERIRWDNKDPQLADVLYSDIVRAMRKVGMAVLIARYVWLEGQRNEMTKHVSGMLFNMGWTVQEAEQFFEALLEYMEDNDKTRLLTVRATFEKADKGRKVTGGPTLRKLIKDGDVLVPRFYEWFGGDGQGVVQEFNDRFAVVETGGKFKIAAMDPVPGKARTLYARNDFINLFGNSYVTGDDGKPKSKALIWLASDRRHQYNDYSFLPGLTQEELDASDKYNGVLNLWTGWAVKASDEGSCKAWLELLWRVMAGEDEERYKWLLNWFASVVRDPMNKTGTVPVFIGRTGAGKTLCLDYFGRILGDAYVPVTKEEHIFGKFNAHLGTCLVLHSEEALYGGDKKHLGTIKSLVTDPYILYEPKGLDPRKLPNYVRLVMSSNNERAAPVEEVDRRFSIFHLRNRKADYDLVKRLLHERDHGGPGALLHYLLHVHDYDPEACSKPIVNDDLMEAKTLNASAVSTWWHQKLETGELVPGWLKWATKYENQEWPCEVMSKALFELFKHESKERFFKEVIFWSELKKLLGIERMKSVKSIRRFKRDAGIDPDVDSSIPKWVVELPDDQRTQTLVGLPSLHHCRELYEQHLGCRLEWPAIEEEKIPNHIEKYMKRPSY